MVILGWEEKYGAGVVVLSAEQSTTYLSAPNQYNH